MDSPPRERGKDQARPPLRLPSSFRDSIRQVCVPRGGQDEDELAPPSAAIEALKRRMGRSRPVRGLVGMGRKEIQEPREIQSQGTPSHSVPHKASPNGEVIPPKDRPDPRLSRRNDPDSRLSPPKANRRDHRKSVSQAPVVCRNGECKLALQGPARSYTHALNPPPKVYKDLPKPPIPPRKSSSFRERLGSSSTSPFHLPPLKEEDESLVSEPVVVGRPSYPDDECSEGGYVLPPVDTAPICVDISEGEANKAFTLLNSDTDGKTEELPVPGWNAIHDFLCDTMDDPGSRLTIMYNTERRPFGKGVIDAVYVIDRGDLWEAVSRGFTEVNMYKETDDPTTNGYGFELVMRVAKKEGEGKSCPGWIMDVMAALLTTKASGRMDVGLGDVFDIDADLIGDLPGAATLAITRDPKWREKLKTSFGTMCFYQVVPLTDKEGSLALSLGTNLFLKALFFGQVPVVKPGRPDMSSHVLWSRFKDDIDLAPVEVAGLAVSVQGADMAVVIPDHPLLVFRLLLGLMHDLPTTWVNPKTDLKCVWLRHNLRETAPPDKHQSNLHHILYISCVGLEKLFGLFDTKVTSWAEEVRDHPPWPLDLELEPKISLGLK